MNRGHGLTVGLGPFDLGEAGRVHATLADQPFDDRHVALRPRAAGAARREAAGVGGVVCAAKLTVDPAIAQGFFECFVVGEARRVGRTLLRQLEPHASRLSVVLVEPAAPGAGVRDDERRKVSCHTESLPEPAGIDAGREVRRRRSRPVSSARPSRMCLRTEVSPHERSPRVLAYASTVPPLSEAASARDLALAPPEVSAPREAREALRGDGP